MELMATNTTNWCWCGHARSAHTTYALGRNTNGSAYVCTKDGCNLWQYCDLADEVDWEYQETTGKYVGDE